MERSAFIIQGMLLFYLLFGLCMAIIPAETTQLKKKLFHSFRIISEQQARKPLGPRERRHIRIFGICCVLACLLILTQMKLRIGKLSAAPIPAWTDAPSKENIHGAQLHLLVRDIVLPKVQKYVGLIVVTVADATSDISGFGRVTLNSDTAPDQETLFEIGSVSKVFTGILLAERIRHSTLSLQSSLASLLPSLQGISNSQAQHISLEQLVTHTAGFPRMPAGTFRPFAIWRALIAGDSYRHYTEQDLFAVIPPKNSEARFRYSNAGFGLLGMILSRQSGKSYHEMIQSAIAQPLGLKDTGVLLSEEQRSRLATGYRSYAHVGPYYLAQQADNWNFPDYLAAAGGLHSSAGDMLTFLKANMGRTATTLRSVLQSAHKTLFSDKKRQIGMAWFHKKLPTSHETIIWHNGMTGGYSSFIGFSENGRVGVAILNNSAKKVDSLGMEILDRLSSHES